MTETDKPAFAQAMTRLAVALREPGADVVQMRMYFSAMHDLEIEFVVAAAEHLIAHAEWFPKPGQWRAAAEKIEAERLHAQKALLRKLAEPLCLACADTGWLPSGPDRRVQRCDCRSRRRAELLGRQPWPALPAGASSDGAVGPLSATESAAAAKVLDNRGLVLRPRVMPWATATPEAEQRDDGQSGD